MGGRGAAAPLHPVERRLPARVRPRHIALSKRFKLEGPLRRWEQYPVQIHDEILERAYDPQRNDLDGIHGSTAL